VLARLGHWYGVPKCQVTRNAQREDGGRDARTDLQGGWFGKIGEWDVNVIEESNRNYGGGEGVW